MFGFVLLGEGALGGTHVNRFLFNGCMDLFRQLALIRTEFGTAIVHGKRTH